MCLAKKTKGALTVLLFQVVFLTKEIFKMISLQVLFRETLYLQLYFMMSTVNTVSTSLTPEQLWALTTTEHFCVEISLDT